MQGHASPQNHDSLAVVSRHKYFVNHSDDSEMHPRLAPAAGRKREKEKDILLRHDGDRMSCGLRVSSSSRFLYGKADVLRSFVRLF